MEVNKKQFIEMCNLQPYKKVAEAFGISESTVNKYAKLFGITKQNTIHKNRTGGRPKNSGIQLEE